ncbi:HAMP domain-containing histidine kinase [Pseudoalteromonas sp. SG45-5]|jgi:signal transduction histidine kinase|uniref:sensor histidine kinase n=1 Tax=unclassified Pseudoalteromonas TaxID=194690 RepID=UPI0015FD9F9E|nr:MULTISPECIES: HAMP domain-containing sensor histidine kinase [unclassified Pseudoalteromonas]MBB1384573.1 HAMP domain-containing histidine kinase [Pseudoalteromonas sp. SG45-5]MBB1394456.1 HAMP domain-containing histidine kinase [Pseudoalteromonas sp. SG44-4]MBB1446601.1 HAMP domain-containing histidine kinase [Pseudoalteromonas sp. SG41-6]
MSNIKVRYKTKTISILVAVFCAIIGPSTGWVYQLSQDILLTTTVAIFLSYLLIISLYKLFNSYFLPITQLQAYIDAKQQGQSNLSLGYNDPNSPWTALGIQIETLFTKSTPPSTQLIDGLFQHWPHPIALFNDQGKLTFFNHPMYRQLKTPLLRGMTIAECGFTVNNKQCSHAKLNQDWQVQRIVLSDAKQILITASYIGHQLQDAKRQSQADLIRILSHELNNSLTPMASMTDTLLSTETLNEKQTRQVLTRIKSRSESLLQFIKSYSELSRLPSAKPQYFDLKNLADLNAVEQSIQLSFAGESQCFADKLLIEQLLINLFKNTFEANNDQPHVTLNSFTQANMHILQLTDNGPGFANLEYAIQPLYTTKKTGFGLGLALCNDIVQKHNGQLYLANTNQGAQITIKLSQGALK